MCRFDWLLHPVSLCLGADDGAAEFRDVQLRILFGEAPTLQKLSKEVEHQIGDFIALPGAR